MTFETLAFVRRIGAASAITFLLLCAPFAIAGAKLHSKYLVYVGTYTDKGSKGIYAYHLDTAKGDLSLIGLAAATENPSFVVIHPNGHFLYAANELSKYEGKDSGAISAFAIDRASGKLTLLNQVPSGGADPCYLSLDKSGKHLLVANYTGGSVSVFPLGSDGKLGNASGFMQHKGSSVNKERQEGPHAHSIDLAADDRFAMVSDLGLDQVLIDRFDDAKGTLTRGNPPFATVDAGSGPRHFKFHPNQKSAYLISELHNTVTRYAYDAKSGELQVKQTISTLPEDFKGHSEAAEIQISASGKFLYASNRGYDSIAVFRLDPSTGELSRIEIVPSGGKAPRYFTFDPSGSRLLVANQDSSNIVMFNIDPKTGKLTQTGDVTKVDSPVCVQFLAED
jgi:6-phosphogluconolactonase